MNTNHPIITDIETALTTYKRRILPNKHRHAAVLMPIICHNGNISVLLTKRSKHIPQHPGEISFPGGMQDKTDPTLEYTALRETHEEIGIEEKNIQIVGALDDEISLAGFRVTPYIGIIKTPTDQANFSLSTDEVEELLTIHLKFFLNPDTAWTERWVRQGEFRDVYFYLHENQIIWGLTARILNKAVHILRDIILQT